MEGDIKFVMGRLGISDCCCEFEEEEIKQVFEETEPSLEEVKEAFDVFDVNKDGFIDGYELKRVLCGLGVVSSEDDCIRMINAFDENGDGRVDFHEFLNCIHLSFS